MFKPSPQQEAIFKWVEAHKDDAGQKALAISALAGTGKTTTILQLVKQMPELKGIYAAFNKSIVTEVEPKLSGTGVQAKTFHSMGYGALLSHLRTAGVTKIDTQEKKYEKIATPIVEGDLAFRAALTNYAQAEKLSANELMKQSIRLLVELARFARIKLAAWDDHAALRDIADLYNLDSDGILTTLMGDIVRFLPAVMRTAEEQTRKGLIDFTDMIYWAVKWELSLTQHALVLLDEAQDLNAMQREMIRRSLSKDGMIVIVGDPNQSIYGFSGADTDSWQLTIDMFGATVLPLSITRRCARIIAYHASQIVPSFEAPDDAPRGMIVTWPLERLPDAVRPGDLIISRVKAPLVKVCFALLALRIPATILGSDIGKGLIAIIERVQKRDGFAWHRFPDYVKAYASEQSAKALARGDESRANAITDECDALIHIYEESKPDTSQALIAQIEALFKDQDGSSKSTVLLSTAHKSKGLEAERVFILAPEKLPLKFDMTPEQADQERNLEYVAYTRAKRVLVFVTHTKWLGFPSPVPYAQPDFEEREWPSEAFALPAPLAPQQAQQAQADIPTEEMPGAAELVSPKGESPAPDMPPAKVDDHPNTPTPTRAAAQAALLAALRKLSLVQALALRDVLDAYIADLQQQAGAK